MVVITNKARGLWASDASRPGDVVVLDFFVEGRHLVMDAVVTSTYRSTINSLYGCVWPRLRSDAGKGPQVPRGPSIAPTHSRRSCPPPRGLVLVPFAIEDGGRLARSPRTRPLAGTSGCSPRERTKPSLRLYSLGDLRPDPCVLVDPTVAATHVFMPPFGHFKACHQAHMP
jgi:hypothetical protein